MDFLRCKLSGRFYGGSEKKIGIVLDGAEYMVKFRKETAFGIRNNHFSEYIGSHIFAALGFNAQETYLGTYRNSQVVACRTRRKCLGSSIPRKRLIRESLTFLHPKFVCTDGKVLIMK